MQMKVLENGGSYEESIDRDGKNLRVSGFCPDSHAGLSFLYCDKDDKSGGGRHHAVPAGTGDGILRGYGAPDLCRQRRARGDLAASFGPCAADCLQQPELAAYELYQLEI